MDPVAVLTALAKRFGWARPVLTGGAGSAFPERAFRERQAWRTTKAKFVAQATYAAVRFISIPLALHALGNEDYGLWITVSSFMGWMALADFGIGSGLVNAVSAAYGRGDEGSMRGHLSTAAFTLLPLAAALTLGTWAFAGSPWSARLLGVGGNAGLAEKGHTLLVIVAAISGLSFALSFVGVFCAGVQEGYRNAQAFTAASVIGLCGLLAVWWARLGLTAFAWAVALPGPLCAALLGLYLFRGRYRHLSPSLSCWNRASVGALLSVGGPMLVVQLSEFVTYQAHGVMISNRLGPSAVPAYSVPFALFMMLAQVCGNIASPYWPAYAEACARHDWHWIRGAALRVRTINLLIMLAGGAGILAVGPAFLRLWTANRIAPGRAMLACLGLYFLAAAWSATTATLLLGLGLTRVRACLAAAVAASHVVGFQVLLPVMGVLALPVAGAAALAVDALVGQLCAARYISSRTARTGQPRADAATVLAAIEISPRQSGSPGAT